MKRAEYKGYCDSEKCAFEIRTFTRKVQGKTVNRNDHIFAGFKIKTVPTFTFSCPDCGAALFWSTTPPVSRSGG